MTLTEICGDLQAIQRQRARLIKSRISLENNRRANVACALGYTTALEEDNRKAMFDEADKTIRLILSGELETPFDGLVKGSELGIESFRTYTKSLEKGTLKLAKQCPVAEWMEAPEQRGFGWGMLAIVIGECGNLADYSGPAKLWKRMGCAPFTKGDDTRMGATWKSGRQGKLSADDWEAFGYSPRRRSIAYLIGKGLMKQNGDGPYRQRYDEAKAALRARFPLPPPDDDGKQKKHPTHPDLRCHLHGMLLATKLLLKNLWREWNGFNAADAA